MNRVLRYYFLAMIALGAIYYVNNHAYTIASSRTDSRMERDDQMAELLAEIRSLKAEVAAVKRQQSQPVSRAAEPAAEERATQRTRAEDFSPDVAENRGEGARRQTSREYWRQEYARREAEGVNYSASLNQRNSLGVRLESHGSAPTEVLWQSRDFNRGKGLAAGKITAEIVVKKPRGGYSQLDIYCLHNGEGVRSFNPQNFASKTIIFNVRGTDDRDASCTVETR